jgi:hypothetical protein
MWWGITTDMRVITLALCLLSVGWCTWESTTEAETRTTAEMDSRIEQMALNLWSSGGFPCEKWEMRTKNADLAEPAAGMFISGLRQLRCTIYQDVGWENHVWGIRCTTGLHEWGHVDGQEHVDRDGSVMDPFPVYTKAPGQPWEGVNWRCRDFGRAFLSRASQ